MITFCTGSARQKRAYFGEASGVVVLDNVEVLFCASENGRNYFAYGDTPFGTFTVVEYLSYRRALNVGDGIDGILKRLDEFGIPRSKLIRKLSPVAMRCVMFLEKTAGKTDKALVVNLDGAKYTRRDNALLKKLVACAPDAFICVTDNLYIKKADAGYKTLAFGKATGARPAFRAAKKLAKRVGAKRVSIY